MFDGDPVSDVDCRSLFHFPYHSRIGHLGDLLAFLIQSLAALFVQIREMTDADKGRIRYILEVIRRTSDSR